MSNSVRAAGNIWLWHHIMDNMHQTTKGSQLLIIVALEKLETAAWVKQYGCSDSKVESVSQTAPPDYFFCQCWNVFCEWIHSLVNEQRYPKVNAHLWGGLLWYVDPPHLGFPRGGLFQKKRQPLVSPGFEELHSFLPWLSLPPHWIQLPAQWHSTSEHHIHQLT